MKKFDPKLLLASTGIALGLVMMVIGLNTGLTGRDASGLPDAIENISPGNNERVLRQSQVIIDFVEGYQATLFIDDIELPTTRLDELTSNGMQPKPGAQIDLPPTAIFDPGNYTISYLPQEGAPIPAFSRRAHRQGEVLADHQWRTKVAYLQLEVLHRLSGKRTVFVGSQQTLEGFVVRHLHFHQPACTKRIGVQQAR